MIQRRNFLAASLLLPFAGCNPSEKSRKPDPDILPLGDVPEPRLLDLAKIEPRLKLDIRYATTNNFTGRQLYETARAFMVPIAAQALVLAHSRAQEDGFGFTIFDAYRPWRVTKNLWDATAPAQRNYVANPKDGSRHNRGCAIDMTLHHSESGRLVEMPSGYDDFSIKAHRDYKGASEEAIANRNRLQGYMKAEDFIGLSNEWWHFDHKDWREYPVMDVDFEEI